MLPGTGLASQALEVAQRALEQSHREFSQRVQEQERQLHHKARSLSDQVKDVEAGQHLVQAFAKVSVWFCIVFHNA